MPRTNRTGYKKYALYLHSYCVMLLNENRSFNFQLYKQSKMLLPEVVHVEDCSFPVVRSYFR